VLAFTRVNLVGFDARGLGLEGVGTEVLDSGQVLRAGIGQDLVFGASQDLINGTVDRLAQDVPQAEVTGRGVHVRPRGSGSTLAEGKAGVESADKLSSAAASALGAALRVLRVLRH
jgi:hypothetical protein